MKYYLVQYRLHWIEIACLAKNPECEMFEFENSLTPLECFNHVKKLLEIKHPADMDGKIEFFIENMTLIS